MSNNVVTLKSGSEVTQGHGFLLVFYSNSVPQIHRFLDIRVVSIQ